ncbi:MAG: inositol monophosphatase [Actinomycetota bacterium]
MRGLIASVETIIAEVAEEVIVPRWRSLDAADIAEKDPGDVVTVADIEAEQALATRLVDLVPGSAVVGEEAVSDDPGVLQALGSADDVWIVDPIDGTGNFAAGTPDFGVMVAQVTGGEIVRSWIHLPVRAETFLAERGAGATRNDLVLSLGQDAPVPADISGVVKTRFLPDDVRPRVEGGVDRIGPLDPSTICSAVEYGRVATGDLDYVFYWRTYPWDHAPGALLVREAGGAARRVEGDDYRVGDDRSGLLVARNGATWEATRSTLLADL